AAVTLLARERAVHARERKPGAVMIEACARPDRDSVALRAVERERAGGVVRVLRREVLRTMAVHALRRHRDERQPPLGRGLVAGFAIDGEVRPAERKARLLMRAHHAGTVEERARGVTAPAIVAQLSAVDVLVARRAAGRDTVEIEGRVTRSAGGLRVRAHQGHATLGVIELGTHMCGGPTLGAVTQGALLLELAVRIADRLLCGRGGPPQTRQSDGQEEPRGSHAPRLTLSPWHVSHLPERGR